MSALDAIKDTIARASWAADEHDADMLADSYMPDATSRIDIGDVELPTAQGRDFIVGFMTQFWSQQTDQRRHYHSNWQVEALSDSSATVVSLGLIVVITDSEASILTTGWYRDQLINQGDRWRIQARHLHLDKPF